MVLFCTLSNFRTANGVGLAGVFCDMGPGRDAIESRTTWTDETAFVIGFASRMLHAYVVRTTVYYDRLCQSWVDLHFMVLKPSGSIHVSVSIRHDSRAKAFRVKARSPKQFDGDVSLFRSLNSY